jgi:hypothetical protein
MKKLVSRFGVGKKCSLRRSLVLPSPPLAERHFKDFGHEKSFILKRLK